MQAILRSILSFILLFYYQFRIPKNNKIVMGVKTILFAKINIKGQNNSISLGTDCTLRNMDIEINGNNNSIIFGDNAKVYEGLKILIESNKCIVKIDKSVTIGSAEILLAEKETKVIIGTDSMLSRDISINTSDFHSIIDVNSKMRINPAKDVEIGKHVWIGNGVFINKGALIGDNCIVAAKSVVTGKNFEKNTLIGGVPAKLIKSGINWDRKII